MNATSAPLFLVALRLEFDDDLEPATLYRVIGSGTEVECKVIADRIPDVVNPTRRPVRSGTVIVTEAAKLKGERVTDSNGRILLP